MDKLGVRPWPLNHRLFHLCQVDTCKVRATTMMYYSRYSPIKYRFERDLQYCTKPPRARNYWHPLIGITVVRRRGHHPTTARGEIVRLTPKAGSAASERRLSRDPAGLRSIANVTLDQPNVNDVRRVLNQMFVSQCFSKGPWVPEGYSINYHTTVIVSRWKTDTLIITPQ